MYNMLFINLPACASHRCLANSHPVLVGRCTGRGGLGVEAHKQLQPCLFPERVVARVVRRGQDLHEEWALLHQRVPHREVADAVAGELRYAWADPLHLGCRHDFL